MAQRTLVQLYFEDGLDEHDANVRGYRSHVWAELDDGARYALTFYTVGRLVESLDYDADAGRPFFTEPGLIIVPEVTLAIMEAAARALARDGFFDRYLARSGSAAPSGDAGP
jgi:hypothetical protein